jgi:transcriptional regulator with XRE-family HTH domain
MPSGSTLQTTTSVLVDSAEGLGEFVRGRRQNQKLRIDDTAQLCGISVAALSRLETANGGVRLETVLRALDGLGVALIVVPKDSPLVASLQRRPSTGGDAPHGRPTGTKKLP